MLVHTVHKGCTVQLRYQEYTTHMKNVHRYMYISRTSCCKSHPALILRILRHSLIRKLFPNYSYSTQREDTNRLATAKTETTSGPTYSMARTIGATAGQKGFICRCHYFVASATHSGSHSLHGPTSPMATSMRAIAHHKRLRECHLSLAKQHMVC